MKVKIKRFDKSLPLSEYKTSGAVGFDLYVGSNERINSHEVKLLKANVAIEVPKNHFCLVQGRSSTPIKFSLLVVPGIVDQDYCGNDDEFTLEVINLGEKIVNLPAGTRIAQGVFVKISKPEFKEVSKLKSKSRGGFGTTGHN